MANSPKLFVSIRDILDDDRIDLNINLYLLKDICWAKGKRVWKSDRKNTWAEKCARKKIMNSKSFFEKMRLKYHIWWSYDEGFIFPSYWENAKVVFVMSDGSKYYVSYSSNEKAKAAYDICKKEILEKYKVNQ